MAVIELLWADFLHNKRYYIWLHSYDSKSQIMMDPSREAEIIFCSD